MIYAVQVRARSRCIMLIEGFTNDQREACFYARHKFATFVHLTHRPHCFIVIVINSFNFNPLFSLSGLPLCKHKLLF